MNRPIAISLSPNTEPDDIAITWQVVTDHSKWRDTAVLKNITEFLEKRFLGRATLFASGRAALAAALKAFEIGRGDEVIVQAFTCVSVPGAVKWTGATPIFADIDPKTYNFDVKDVASKITSRTRAIIIQHTFGIPGPIREIQALAATHNMLVIEDCAHALGGSLDGKPLGSFGDAAIFSFGRDKIVSCVFGGAVVTRHPQIAEQLTKTVAHLTPPPSWWVLQQLLHPLFVNMLLPWYFSGVGKVGLVVLQKIGFLSKAVETKEKTALPPSHIRYTLSPALGHLLWHQLQKLDQFTAKRTAIASQYASALGDTMTIQNNEHPAWLRYPLQMKNAQQVLLGARSKRMLLGDWYRPVIAPEGSDLKQVGYVPGSCPQAEEAASCVINLPTYPLLTDTQVQQVISYITSEHSL